MTDLEINKLCAQAMGRIEHCNYVMLDGIWLVNESDDAREAEFYDPLHDDIQAMALVKRFHLHIDSLTDNQWSVDAGWLKPGDEVENDDLNRAICECVAKMLQIVERAAPDPASPYNESVIKARNRTSGDED